MRTTLCTASVVLTRLKLPASITNRAGPFLCTLRPQGASSNLWAATAQRVIVIGGTSVGPRHIWWNFVASSEARIERAKQDWAEMRMGTVPGDDEFIPLPTN